MARTSWKCPYPNCKQESSRNWNLQRHILRAHNAVGNPVKDKSFATEEYMSMSSKNTKFSSFHSKQVASPRPREEKDVVDWIYERVKEVKSKKDKITEIKNFFSSESSNSTVFPPLYIGPNASPLSSEITGMSKQAITEFDPPVGFRTYICVDCLTGSIAPVNVSDFINLGPLAFEHRHACKQEDLENRKRRAEKKIHIDVIKTWDELRKRSIQCLADIVHQMVGLHNPIPLLAFEKVGLEPWFKNSMPTNLGKIDKNHWSSRALIAKESTGTTISNRELMDFLNLTKATLAPFQAEIDGEVRYFYLYIPYLYIPSAMY